MKFLSYGIFFLLASLSLYSKTKEADTLVEYTRSFTDRKKLAVWNKFCFDRLSERPYEVLALAPKALALADKLKDKKLRARFLRYYGCASQTAGDLKNAYNYCYAAYTLANSIKDTAIMTDALNDLGITCRYWGAYDMATNYLLRKIRLLKSAKNSLEMAQAYVNLANVLKDMERYKESEEYYYKALYIAKRHKSLIGQAIIYANLASLAEAEKNFYEAIAYVESAEKMFGELGSFRYELAQMQVVKAQIYLSKGDIETAGQISSKALAEISESDFNNSVAGIYIIHADVLTKQKRYEEALQFINTGLNFINESDVIIDKISAYERMKDLYYEMGDIKGGYKAFDKYVALRDSVARQKAQYKAEFLESVYSNKLKQQEIKALTRDGNIKTWLIALFAASTLFALLFIFLLSKKTRELKGLTTQLNMRNDNLNEANERLREANAGKEKFFSIIAHDLINPVTVLTNDTKFLSRSTMDLNSKQAKILINDLNASAMALKDFIENLLLWARSSSNKIPFNPNRYNLRDVVVNTMAVLQSQAREKHIVTDINVPSDAVAFFDVNMITTVMRNLISNAVKFSPEGGKVSIDVEENAGGFRICVADTGIGISKEDQKKLFRTDVHYTTIGTSKEKGTGLGLILCKEFVLKHGGEIWVESEPGTGARFVFTLPGN